MEEHDFKEYPELSNKQIEEMPFESPHVQITEHFEAEVVKVHDGDTITLRTEFRDFDFPLRFADIDAPEMNEGGAEARDWLRERILGEMVQVQINVMNRVDKYGRLLGRVFHLGSDVGQDALRLGIVKLFGMRGEGKLPNIDKLFSEKEWFRSAW